MRAIVTDVHVRSALSGLRGLGVAGVETTAMAPSRLAGGMWSRHAGRRAVGPDVTVDPVAFAGAVEAEVARGGPCFVYPGREEAIDALLADRPEPAAWLPYASRAALRLRDKRTLADATAAVGLAAPRVAIQATAADLKGAAVPLPCVVKAPLPGSEPLSSVFVDTAQELETLLASMAPGQPLLVQERVTGQEIVLALVLRRDGGLAAAFQQEVLTTWPVEGGTTIRAVGVVPDPVLVERARRLLSDAGYWGLAELDIILGPSGPVVLDVNPRYYETMPLALASGVNLAAAWHAVALGDGAASPPPYRAGLTFRWFEGELLAAVRGPAPLRGVLRGADSGAVWDPVDRRPGVVEASSWIPSFATRRVRRTLDARRS